MTVPTKRTKRTPDEPAAAPASRRPPQSKPRKRGAKAQLHAREEARALKEALAKASGGRAPRANGKQPARKLSAKERETLRGVVIYLDDEARKQLARLAIDQGRTTQDLGVEAVNLLFELYGLGAIA